MNEITIRIFCERCRRNNCNCPHVDGSTDIPWHDIDVERVIDNMPEHVRTAIRVHISSHYNER